MADAASDGLAPIAAAILGPLGAPFRFALSEEQLASAQDYVTQQQRHGTRGLAASSCRTRAADWLTWLAFCAHYDRVVLPARFDDVRELLDQLVAAGRKKATLEHLLWSLADIHRRHGCPGPMDSAIARDYWRDLVREQLDGEQRQAAPMTLDLLDQLVTALLAHPLTVRRVAAGLRPVAEHAQRRRRARDAAMLHVAYDLMMRSAELVAMEWARLMPLPHGGATYRLGKTKTDQAGVGRTLYLRPATLAALDAWRTQSSQGEFVFHAISDDVHLDPAGAPSEAVGAQWQTRRERARQREQRPLGTREVSAVFRRAVSLAGLDLDLHWLTGHSARVGAAQDMVRAGSSTAQVQVAGRWASERMPIRYAERVLARDAGEDRFAKLAAMQRRRDRS
ncbi:integrase [Luteibacter sp. Sphag1AF]|uniref:tyrosine-type recombinase/integrase n=1 Tax=Luteibacter sp. Sphag1AF TaxID=2587031 RepID=UPI0016112861|nr:tyrosine-type recombinase/integrase [Luteibacter sp. Sphag1AF]MBB3228173.1 integrase [Luteibacter sp. Sphag1AF]